MPARLKIAFVLLIALLVQTTLAAALRLGEVRPDVMLLVGIAAGFARGPERGAVVGCLAGFLADLFVQTPFGLSALTYTVVGFGVGALHTGIIRSSWWLPAAVSFTASAAGVVLFAVFGAVVGQTHLVNGDLVLIAATVSVANGAIGVGAVRLLGWALRRAPDTAYA